MASLGLLSRSLITVVLLVACGACEAFGASSDTAVVPPEGGLPADGSVDVLPGDGGVSGWPNRLFTDFTTVPAPPFGWLRSEPSGFTTARFELDSANGSERAPSLAMRALASATDPPDTYLAHVLGRVREIELKARLYLVSFVHTGNSVHLVELWCGSARPGYVRLTKPLAPQLSIGDGDTNSIEVATQAATWVDFRMTATLDENQTLTMRVSGGGSSSTFDGPALGTTKRCTQDLELRVGVLDLRAGDAADVRWDDIDLRWRP